MKATNMERIYEFSWYPTKENKYGTAIERKTTVKVGLPTGNTAFDAKRALATFTKEFGSLKQNTIVKIKEFDENLNQIGEDIVPMEGENAIIPIKK